MSIDTMTLQAAIAGQWRRDHEPEGIEVVVVTDDPRVAEAVAQRLAEMLFPDRVFGEILHIGEPVDLRGIPVVVRDLGAKR